MNTSPGNASGGSNCLMAGSSDPEHWCNATAMHSASPSYPATGIITSFRRRNHKVHTGLQWANAGALVASTGA
jgi:hypothetical protein